MYIFASSKNELFGIFHVFFDGHHKKKIKSQPSSFILLFLLLIKKKKDKKIQLANIIKQKGITRMAGQQHGGDTRGWNEVQPRRTRARRTRADTRERKIYFHEQFCDKLRNRHQNIIEDLAEDDDDGSFGIGGLYFWVTNKNVLNTHQGPIEINIDCEHSRNTRNNQPVRDKALRICSHFVMYLDENNFDPAFAGATLRDATAGFAPILRLPRYRGDTPFIFMPPPPPMPTPPAPEYIPL